MNAPVCVELGPYGAVLVIGLKNYSIMLVELDNKYKTT